MQFFPTVTRREWRYVILFAAIVMALTTVPYLFGLAAQAEDWRFGWFMFGVNDSNTYLGKMRQGANGHLLYTMAFTSEPHEATLIFTLYVLGGQVAGMLAPATSPALVDAMLLVFHAARLAFGFLLILVTYRFIALFVRSIPLRWLAILLSTLGGGLGWLLFALGLDSWLGSQPVDLIVPESYTFYSLYGLPHLALARSMLLSGFMIVFHALRLSAPRRWVPWMLLAGLCWLVMAICVPFYVMMLSIVLAAWGLAALIRQRKFPAALFWRCAVGLLIPSLMFLYNVYVFSTNPVLRIFQIQNLVPASHPLHYVLGYGMYLLLALPAVGWSWRRGRREIPYLLLLAWPAAGPLLTYLPVEVQRRLLEGIFVPLCILAAVGLRRWWLWRGRRPAWTWRAAASGALVLALLTPAMLMFSGIVLTQSRDPRTRLFHTSGELAALDWLGANAPPGAVVMTNGLFNGSYVPARTNLRAYIGHGVETVNYDEKLALVTRFYGGEMSAEEQQALFERGRIQYVLFSPYETRTVEAPGLQLLYDAAGYRIFAVKQPAP